ncbi:hypothetical protein EDB19DRAFT_1831067 [Suillus lakei]|nr:hypothetical protein EDB19DRAFT_1831067 [Suillus lakei]
MDLAKYLMISAHEHVTHAIDMKFFPCDDGKRCHIKELFASTEINRQLGNCDCWDLNIPEELIPIASSEFDRSARHAAFTFLCGPLYPSKFSSYAFIPGIRHGEACQIFHDEVSQQGNLKLSQTYQDRSCRVLLKCPRTFLNVAGDHERYLAELRMIAMSHKSFPKQIREEMCNAPIFLGYQRCKSNGLDGHSREPDGHYKICKIEEIPPADDMESRHTSGNCVYIAPQELNDVTLEFQYCGEDGGRGLNDDEATDGLDEEGRRPERAGGGEGVNDDDEATATFRVERRGS